MSRLTGEECKDITKDINQTDVDIPKWKEEVVQTAKGTKNIVYEHAFP